MSDDFVLRERKEIPTKALRQADSQSFRREKVKKEKPKGTSTSNIRSKKGSLEHLVKHGTFIPEKGGLKEGKMPGGPIVGTIVGPDLADKPEKVIFVPVAGNISISPGEAGGIEKAKKLFQEANLAFPWIPPELASQLRELYSWRYGTRSFRMSPYNIDAFIKEAQLGVVDDYVVLAQAGHGANSWALHYFILYGPLYLFLQLSWGGAYCDAEHDRNEIRRCFGLADKIVRTIDEALHSPMDSSLYKNFIDIWIRVYGSAFYGSRWSNSEEEVGKAAEGERDKSPYEVLSEVLEWVRKRRHQVEKESTVPAKRLWATSEVLEACDPHASRIIESIFKEWTSLGFIVQKGFGTIRLRVLVNEYSALLATLNPNRDYCLATINLVWDHLRRTKYFSKTAIGRYQEEVSELAKLRIGKNWASFAVDEEFSSEKAEKLIRAMEKLARSKN